MQHMITFHIHLGYTFCIVMVLSVILFFTFFGKVCTDFKNGDDKLDTCKKFTDEIMITGLVGALAYVPARVYSAVVESSAVAENRYSRLTRRVALLGSPAFNL